MPIKVLSDIIYRFTAKDISSNILWSRSNTKDFLTSFAEGISCKTYDKHEEYVVRVVSLGRWMVLKKDSLELSTNISSIPSFIHVRKVVLTDGFLNCSCNRPSQWLLPCVHIGAVLYSLNKMFTPSMFNIRWWKISDYFAERNDNRLADICKQCRTIDNRMGLHVGDELTIERMEMMEDDIHRLMLRMEQWIEEKGFLVKDSSDHRGILLCSSAFPTQTLGEIDRTIMFDSSINENDADIEVNYDVVRRRLYGPFVDLCSNIQNLETLDSVESEFEKFVRRLKIQKRAANTNNDMSVDTFGAVSNKGVHNTRALFSHERKS